MKHISKSYLRTYFSNWIESIGLLIFVIVIFLFVIGMLASPIQFSLSYSKINRNYNDYDAAVKINSGRLADDFLYDYYCNPDGFSIELNNQQQIIGWDIDEITGQQESILGPWFDITNPDFKIYCENFFGFDDSKPDPDNDPQNQSAIKDACIENVMMLLKYYSSPLEIKSGSDMLTPRFNFILADTSETWMNTTLTSPPVWNNAVNHDFANLYDVLKQSSEDVKNLVVPNESVILLSQLKTQLNLDFKAYDTPGLYLENDGNYYFVQPFSSNADDIDNVVLSDKDSNAPNDNQVVINSRYSYYNNKDIGDKLNVVSTNYTKEYEISGIGSRISDFYPVSSFNSFTKNFDNYTSFYISQDQFVDLVNNYFDNNGVESFDYYYQTYSGSISAYIENGDNMSVNTWNEILDQITTISDNGSSNYVAFNDLSFSKNIFNIEIQIILFALVGIIALFLAVVFINFVIKKEMNKTITQLGVFKAFGYKKRQLSWIFALKTAITIFIGAVVGMLLSFPMQIKMQSIFSNGINMVIEPIYSSVLFILIIIILVPLLFTVLGYLLTIKFLFKPTLSLLNNDIKKQKSHTFVKKINRSISKFPFLFKMQGFYVFRSFGKVVIVFSLFSICSLLMMVQLSSLNVVNDMTYSGWSSYAFSGGNTITFDKMNYVNSTDPQKPGISKPYLPFKDYDDTSDLDQMYNTERAKNKDFFTELDKWDNSNIPNDNVDFNKVKNQELFSFDNTNPDDPKFSDPFILSIDDLQNYFLEYAYYYTGSFQLPDPKILESIIILNNTLEGIKNYKGENTYVSFNNFMYNSLNSYAYYYLYVLPGTGYNSPFWYLETMPDENFAQYFNLKGVSQNDLNTVVNFQPTGPDDVVPVIISESVSVIDGLNAGDTFNVTVPDYAFHSDDLKKEMTLKVQGVASENLSVATVYMGQNAFWESNVNNYNSNNNYYYNAIVSTSPSLYANIDAIVNSDFPNLDPRYNENIYNYYYDFSAPDANANSYTLGDISPQDALNNFLDIPYFANNYSDIFPLNILQDLLDVANQQLLTVFSINIALVVMILFVILTVVITGLIDESISFILILKALGYKNPEINFIVIGNYGFSIPIAVTLSAIINIPIWIFVQNLLITKSTIIIPSPFTWGVILITFAIVAFIIGMAWLLGLNRIKKAPIGWIQT
ncbi:ABC transporter permease [Spiroplasma endosymbiont of Amphibalanus improvisus]|uniref:ABC transporter permease n=1 Tax=Spiroplasma endosymbiont of Amphibalanus improvisus TaxID=3066327 RepID=UPI00313B1A59